MTVRADWLRGCATALVTPFTADGAVDEGRMRALVERQIAGGVKLLVPCGTTGESATLSSDEQQRVIAITIAAAKGKARVTSPRPRPSPWRARWTTSWRSRKPRATSPRSWRS